MAETWISILDWPDEASNYGRVHNSKTGRIMKETTNSGDPYSSLIRNVATGRNEKSCGKVHAIIAFAFHGKSRTGRGSWDDLGNG